MAEIHSVSILQFAPFLGGRGIDVLDFFSREGVAPNIFQAHDIWVPRSECLRLANALVRATGDPSAGACLGSAVRLTNFGEFGNFVSRSETVGVACRTAIENLSLVHRGSRLRASQEGDRVLLSFSLEGPLGHDPWQFILASLAVLRNIVLLSGEADQVTVRLSIPYAPRWSALEGPLGERLEFGSAVDGLLVPRSLLDNLLSRPPTANRDRDSLETTVRAARIVAASLANTPVRIDSVATRLGLTRRTLQRRLRDCGVVFSDLVDVTRRDAALHHLTYGSQNLTQLALELGYSDPAHFTRSFKRWTATTPSAYARSQHKTEYAGQADYNSHYGVRSP